LQQGRKQATKRLTNLEGENLVIRTCQHLY
jgi:hypothetical protein